MMKFAIVVAALLCAQLLSETALASLQEMSGLTGKELEEIFGTKMEDIEKKMAGIETEELKSELRRRTDLTPDQVLSLLQQAGDPSTRLYNRHTVQEFVALTQRDPKRCTVTELKRVVDLYQAGRYTVREHTIRDNVVRYGRQQFTELFEYCLKVTGGKAFPERFRNIHSEESNKLDGWETKIENLLLRGMTVRDAVREMSERYSGPKWASFNLDSIIEDDEVLYRGHAVGDFKSTAKRDPSLCTIKELKRRIVMFHGDDPNMSTKSPGKLESNLAAVCREQFNELVEYCLKESPDEQFKKYILGLYKASDSNAEREHPGLLTSMESVILRMPSKE